MAVTIKSPREIELMRKAGEILAATHEELRKALKPGGIFILTDYFAPGEALGTFGFSVRKKPTAKKRSAKKPQKTQKSK